MRANAQKAISNAINKREELRLRSHTHCMSWEMREGWRGREGSDITLIYSILVSIKELEELKQQFSKFANKNNMLSKEDFNKLLISKVGEQGMYFMEDMFKVRTLSSLFLICSLSLIGVSSLHFSSCPTLFS